jgi:N-methylhydantoinase A
MQCNGGTVGWETVPPIRVISSGPTGGVIGSQYIASMLKHPNVISTDMGGTSFDVSLLREGKWDYEREPIISRWRIMLPMIKVESIGAGGGTIARVDPITNRLLVGPDSAGAAPGPVCYEAGGTEPTVCDANLILGLLNPDYFLGGRMKVNKAKAEQAMRDKIATPLKMDMVEAAAGIYTIVNAHMAELIRVCAMGAGLSPEEFVIYAFGGTGPLHAAYYAKELNIKRVYVFPFSSVFSAFGIAGTDIIRTASFSMSYMMPVAPQVLDSKVRECQDTLAREMEKEGLRLRELEFRHMFNMRYRRQVNYHTISMPGKEYKTDNDTKEIVDKWAADFEKVYGKGVAYTKGGIEVVSMDIDVIGKTVKPVLKSVSGNGKDSEAALKGHRKVFFPEITKDFVETRIYEYDRLRPMNEIKGPAIIENWVTTIVVPPGALAKVDPFLSVVIEL